jgi:hypothetical protein
MDAGMLVRCLLRCLSEGQMNGAERLMKWVTPT